MAILGIVLYAFLAFAAVETIVRRSTVRWCVAGTIGTFFVRSTALWRRWTWSDRAAASALTLVVTLAITAWLPGGLDGGMRAAGLSASMVLSLCAAVGVLLAAWNLWLVERLPIAVRLGVGITTLYGALAFLLPCLGLGSENGAPWPA